MRTFSGASGNARAFQSILSNVSASLANMAVGMGASALSSGLSSIAGGLFGGGGGAPSVGLFADGGVVAVPTFFGSGGGLGLMGERGAEAIMPLARGPNGQLGVVANGAGGSSRVTVNISTPDAESFRKSQSQVHAAIARAVARGQRGL
jgi:phage-related minor tail protein